jgi:beta-mannosidase
MEVTVNALSSILTETIDFKDEIITKEDERKSYVEYLLYEKGKVVSSGTVLFVRPKHFEFLNPEITSEVFEEDDNFIVVIK